MKTPMIGLTLRLPAAKNHAVGTAYLASVQAGGGAPFLIPAGCPEWADDYMALADGLILTGGIDVNPLLYGQEPVPQVTDCNTATDKGEFALLEAAIRQHKPVLGICRGIQVLNVALGGTLYQDIPSQIPGCFCHRQSDSDRAEGTHTVHIQPDTCLHGILQKEKIITNSFHHQSVREVGRGLTVSARTGDGVVEAVESADGMILGVQWHPEQMWETDADALRLFAWFCDRCRK